MCGWRSIGSLRGDCREIEPLLAPYGIGRGPDFIVVHEPVENAVPECDGAGVYLPLRDLPADQPVGLIVIEFATRRRFRINGVLSRTSGNGLRIDVEQAYGNCPRYIHRMRFESLSPHAPRDDYEPPDAEWKQHFTDVLPCTPPS